MGFSSRLRISIFFFTGAFILLTSSAFSTRSGVRAVIPTKKEVRVGQFGISRNLSTEIKGFTDCPNASVPAWSLPKSLKASSVACRSPCQGCG